MKVFRQQGEKIACTTIGELKKAIQNLDDNLPLMDILAVMPMSSNASDFADVVNVSPDDDWD